MGEKGESFDLDALTASNKPTEESKLAQSSEQSQGKKQENIESKKKSVLEQLDTRIKASPVAKKIAQEKNIDLKLVEGSGPNGRIIMKDLENISSSVASTSAAESYLPHELQEKVIPLTRMRKVIAKKLSESKNSAPHFYLTTSAKMDASLAWRSQLNKQHAHTDKTLKVSVNDLIILSVAKALCKHPQVNSAWSEDHIKQFASVNIAIAVSLESGLVTPVLRNVERMSLREIAVHSKLLVQKARDNKLTLDDFEGATFTISNLGMTCIEDFTAIINPPAACILAVGSCQKQAIVSDNDTIEIAQVMKTTLSSDHRVVDGMVGAAFMDTLKQYLENPADMLY